MTAIHWESRVVWGRMPPRAVQLWNIYAAMVNNEGVAWPSLSHLTELMGATKRDVASTARQWLIAHGALEVVADYVPPGKRGTAAANATAHDAPMFARLTGRVVLDGQTYDLAYFPGHQAGMDEMKPPRRSKSQSRNGDYPQSPNGDRPSHQTVTSTQSPNGDPTQSPNGDPNVVPSNVIPNSTYSAAAAVTHARARESSEIPQTAAGQGAAPLSSSDSLAAMDTDTPSPYAAVFSAWHKTGALMTGQIADELKDAVGEFGEAFVIAAIEEMGRSNARNLKYLRSIMDRCRAEGRMPGAPRPSTRPPAAQQAAKRAATEDPDNWAGKASGLDRPLMMGSAVPPGWKPGQKETKP